MPVVRFVSRLLAGVIVAESILFALSQWHVLPEGSALSGASYLPPSWSFAGVVVIAGACAVAGARRSALAAALSFLVLVVPFGDFRLGSRSRGAAAAPVKRRLTVVALNVQYYSHGLETVVGALKRTDADVALLSENVLDAAGAARAQSLFAPWFFRMGRSGETAIASRHPIVAFREIDLPTVQASLSGPNQVDQAPGERRSFTHAILDLNGARVNVLSLRLIAGRAPEGNLLGQARWGAYLVRAQAQEVEAFLRYAATLSGPVIFGGDLNAPPSATVVGRLARSYDDAYLSRHALGKPTFRVHPTPYLRLDYLFASRDVETLDARRLELDISDHFPVWAEFALPGRP